MCEAKKPQKHDDVFRSVHKIYFLRVKESLKPRESGDSDGSRAAAAHTGRKPARRTGSEKPGASGAATVLRGRPRASPGATLTEGHGEPGAPRPRLPARSESWGPFQCVPEPLRGHGAPETQSHLRLEERGLGKLPALTLISL